MPDQTRDRTELESILADNNQGLISAQDIRDLLKSIYLAAEADEVLADTPAFASMTDGTTTATAADIEGTFKFRSANTAITVAVESNHVTHGDNLLLTFNPGNVSHDDLDDLEGDSHPVYFYLDGRSGGQIACGGADAGDNLILSSTIESSKGKIIMGTSAYDEANNRLGIGTNSPSTALHVASGGVITAGRLTGLNLPSADSDAASKAYVDATIQGLDIKLNCRVATTANINLSSAPSSIDSVSLSANDRVLVKNQSTASQNGIYVWNGAASAMTRATDADASSEVTAGLFTFVAEGSTHADTGWVLVTDDAITLGTTSLTFTQFSSTGDIVAGNGLVKTGLTVDVVGTADRISVSADAVDIASTYVGQTSLITLGTVTTGTWQAGHVTVIDSGNSRLVTSSTGVLLNSGTSGALGSTTKSLGIGEAVQTHKIGQISFANGMFSAIGDCQKTSLIFRRAATSSSGVELTGDGSTPSGTTEGTSNRYIIASNTSYGCTITVMGRKLDGSSAMFKRMAVIKNVSGTVSLEGSVQTIGTDISPAGWTVAITADNTNKALAITATASNATAPSPVNWVAHIDAVELIYS